MKQPRVFALELRPADAAVGNAVEGDRFLGRFDTAALRAELEQAGVFQRLAALQYADPQMYADREGSEHRLKIRSSGSDVSLLELRVTEATAMVVEPVLRAQGLDLISLLCVHWLGLQHPTGAFTPARPRLPGQRYPGLALSKRLYHQVRSWAEAWGKDGLLNSPEYFHNAVFYAEIFRFLSVQHQGRFEALVRDLAHLHVAQASAALAEGRVIEEATGSPFVWEPGEMVAAIAPGLRAGLESAQFRQAVDEVRETLRYRVRPDGLKEEACG